MTPGESRESELEQAAVYAEIRRVDQLGQAESRRIDGLLKAQETAVNAALAAAEKAVAAALAASEKAVNKAETAQAGVNISQNEFRGTLRDQASTLMPRAEAENLVRELRALIADHSRVIADMRSRLDVGPPSLSVLQTRSDVAEGKSESGTANRAQNQWTFERILTIVGIGAGALYFILNNSPRP